MTMLNMTPTLWLLLVVVMLLLGALLGYVFTRIFERIDDAECPPQFRTINAAAMTDDVRKLSAQVPKYERGRVIWTQPDPTPAPPAQKKPTPAHWDEFNELREARELANEEERMLGRAAALHDVRTSTETRNPHHNGTLRHLMWDVGYQQMLREKGRPSTTTANGAAHG